MNSRLFEEVKNDCKVAIKEAYTLNDLLIFYDYDKATYEDDFKVEVFDRLWIDDSVTGNASESYTFSREKAKQNVMESLDDLRDMCNEYEITKEEIGDAFINGNFERLDVALRCYYLNSAIDKALDELFDESLERYFNGEY